MLVIEWQTVDCKKYANAPAITQRLIACVCLILIKAHTINWRRKKFYMRNRAYSGSRDICPNRVLNAFVPWTTRQPLFRAAQHIKYYGTYFGNRSPDAGLNNHIYIHTYIYMIENSARTRQTYARFNSLFALRYPTVNICPRYTFAVDT